MARRRIKRYWVGSKGPFLYDSNRKYKDGVNFTAFRADEVLVTGDSSNPSAALRRSDREDYILRPSAGVTQTPYDFVLSQALLKLSGAL